MSRTISLLFCTFILCTPVFGLTETIEMGHLKTTVYAPDWIWQKNAVNILVVLENEGSQPADCTVQLVFPKSLAEHFDFDPKIEEVSSFHIPPRTTVRHAFTNIEALGGVELQTYPFQVQIARGTRPEIVEYPLTTIRGPLVSSAQWAMLLPAFIGLACCLLFVAAGKKFSQPRAWRTPSEPIAEPEKLEDWIDHTP